MWWRSIMDRTMFRIIIIAMLALSVSACADEAPKYQRGDCITPINESYSWYGKFAKVEAYSPIENFTKEKSYILAFPFHGSGNAIFIKEIEAATKKVRTSLCEK
jgi:hypothetical protein